MLHPLSVSRPLSSANTHRITGWAYLSSDYSEKSYLVAIRALAGRIATIRQVLGGLADFRDLADCRVLLNAAFPAHVRSNLWKCFRFVRWQIFGERGWRFAKTYGSQGTSRPSRYTGLAFFAHERIATASA
jgi:hypothetical protein